MIEIKIEETWKKKDEEVRKEKGSRYATVTSLASILGAIALGTDSEEEMKKDLEEIIPMLKNSFPPEYIQEAMAINDIYVEDGKISIYEAADIYYERQKEIGKTFEKHLKEGTASAEEQYFAYGVMQGLKKNAGRLMKASMLCESMESCIGCPLGKQPPMSAGKPFNSGGCYFEAPPSKWKISEIDKALEKVSYKDIGEKLGEKKND